jgi:hypothetical protein
MSPPFYQRQILPIQLQPGLLVELVLLVPLAPQVGTLKSACLLK